MKRVGVIAIGVGALAAGVVMGFVAASRMQVSESVRAIATAAAAGAGTKVFVLEQLRSGNDTRAISMLETSLDSDLVTIGLVPESATEATIGGVVRRVARYRTDNPYRSGDPVVDNAVSAVLSPTPRITDKQ
jgi:hypothetical protein